MKIAVWKTGHIIADTVADALAEGFYNESKIRFTKEFLGRMPRDQTQIGYGILRGNNRIFCQAEISGNPWFNVDRGYFNPGHFDGYYRISHKGTQAKYDPAFDAPECDIELDPICKDDKSKPVLFCPPTEAVAQFFLSDCTYGGIFSLDKWCLENVPLGGFIKREKGDKNPIDWDSIRAVITFNSSVGWQAIQRGIPCMSDPLHSVVGSYYNTKSIDELIEMFNTKPRKPLFNFMRAHQFTLDEIRQGNANWLINYYLSKYSSAGTAEKPSLQTLPPTPSTDALQHRFQSNT